ncbi:MAG: hypothetical protein Q7I95_05650 [Thiobacillus sp.]|nr:hypothetical protein [Thiobacillus sp.]
MRRWMLLLCVFAVGAAHGADMTTLRYMDGDPSDPPYLTRILLTPDFMRLDDGNDDGDFVLLDRRQQKVINVMRGNQLAMVFSAGTLPPRPAGWKPVLDVKAGAPGTRRFSLTVKGVVCSEGVAAARATPDAARAMAELKSILAPMQYRVWQDSPAEIQHDCDLANQVWESGTTLKLGLPLEEREFTGRTRQFESVSTQPLQPELFRVTDVMPLIDATS